MEADKQRRQILSAAMMIGFLIFLYAMGTFIFGTISSARITQNSIDYDVSDFFHFIPPVMQPWLYMFACLLPFFVSHERKIKIVGGSIVGGLLMTMTFKKYALTSVWCFFAAMSSLLIALPPVMAALKRRRLSIEMSYLQQITD